MEMWRLNGRQRHAYAKSWLWVVHNSQINGESIYVIKAKLGFVAVFGQENQTTGRTTEIFGVDYEPKLL